MLQLNLGILYCDTDAKFRNEVLSNTKHMIERLRGATTLLARELDNISLRAQASEEIKENQPQGKESSQKEMMGLLKTHKDFIVWYLGFLLGELIPTASYQRHITALRAVALLLRSGIDNSTCITAHNSDNATMWPLSIAFFSTRALRLLIDLLLDPFEDVRSTATEILRLASPAIFEVKTVSTPLGPTDEVQVTKIIASLPVTTGVSTPDEGFNTKGRPLGILLDFIDKAKELSKQTGRADHADGLARSLELLYSLQTSNDEQVDFVTKLLDELDVKLNIAENNLGHAVLGAPIHGNFAALR